MCHPVHDSIIMDFDRACIYDGALTLVGVSVVGPLWNDFNLIDLGILINDFCILYS